MWAWMKCRSDSRPLFGSGTHDGILSTVAKGYAGWILARAFAVNTSVACGFEHSVANMYVLPIGMVLTIASASPIGFGGVLTNLLIVTIGNILGGTVLVALVYWSVYLRRAG